MFENTSVASSDYTWLNGTIFCSVRTKQGGRQSLAISEPVHTLNYRFKGANIFLHPRKPIARAGWTETLMSYGNIFPKLREREMKFWYQFTACGLRWSAGYEPPYLCSRPCLNFLTKSHHGRCIAATVLYLRLSLFSERANFSTGIFYQNTVSNKTVHDSQNQILKYTF